MNRDNPVDELAHIRAEIARLRQHEAALQARLLSLPEGQLTGRWNIAEPGARIQRRFLPALLPDQLRLDPQNWHSRTIHFIICKPIAPQPCLRPGWPIQRLEHPILALH